ncbi:(2Fe-2S)-binding protein [Kitasatospora sp. A2-31]|uniref:(2Fe-2S)-binding protein n=1 Tax=Kitasatospora sp. A2-31 TaxID=2916414 RepID=UPI0027E2C20B|nr:(2Fe-2S)-binding protein [Kitasatospora sp. A2-31]
MPGAPSALGPLRADDAAGGPLAPGLQAGPDGVLIRGAQPALASGAPAPTTLARTAHAPGAGAVSSRHADAAHARQEDAALAADYRRLVELCPALALTLLAADDPDPAPAQGWHSAARLADDPTSLAEALAGESARIAPLAAEHGTSPRPHVAASRLLHHYVWSACLLIVGPWHLARRVPVIDPRDLWLHAPTGDLALRPRSHRTLPGDDELRAELRAAVVAHVEPLLTAFAGPTRRGTRALWGMVTDDLASAVWYLGRMLGEEAAAVAAAAAVLPGGTRPLPGAADFRVLRGTDGREHHTRTRLGCCLYYAIRPDSACLTCPRTSDEERLRRF